MNKYFVGSIFGFLIWAASCTASKAQNTENIFSADDAGDSQSSSISIIDASSVCPTDMVEISGKFCPNVVQECLNLDMTVHNANGYVRCLEFSKTKCLSSDNQKVNMHFCMDKFEWPNKENGMPAVMVTWVEMKKNCENLGKRLCVDHEWSMACEGNEILPYPYGYKRDANICNIDHQQRPWFNAATTPLTPENVAKLNQSVASGSMEKCVSPYGVHDMTGNVDEWVVNSSGVPYKSGLMGGHWIIGARNRCRPETLAHNETSTFYEIGGRCCKDIQ